MAGPISTRSATILFEMVTGGRPYDHESKVTLLGMHVTAPIPTMASRVPSGNIPPELDAVVTRLLAKEAATRFDDARELIDELDRLTAQLTASGLLAAPLPASSVARTPRASGPRVTGLDAPSSATVVGPSRVGMPSASEPAEPRVAFRCIARSGRPWGAPMGHAPNE
jgi:hypothetical protein